MKVSDLLRRNFSLQEHTFATYITLRLGIAVLGFAFPLLLWIIGQTKGVDLQQSLSAYYHANPSDHTTRNWFVGILFAVGVFLYLYKGFSRLENYVLNAAGILALCIALIPMDWNCGTECSFFTLHGISAITFFLCIAFVCVKCAPDTLYLLQDEDTRKKYRWVYKVLGTGMILSPLIALIVNWTIPLFQYVIAIETVGIWIFATYWAVKSYELYKTHAQQSALQAASLEAGLATAS